jgi:hypothetical protein
MQKHGKRLGSSAVWLALLASLALSGPASARQWNPDARVAALDYTQILHAKPNGEIVFMWWAVPENFPNDPNSQIIKDVLSRYVVIGIAHGRSNPGGTLSFDNIPEFRIADQTSRSLAPLPANATPPEVTQTISTLQTLARQSIASIGQGMRWFVFDGSTIHDCAAGKMSVPFGGETYTYDTPIPGCAK